LLVKVSLSSVDEVAGVSVPLPLFVSFKGEVARLDKMELALISQSLTLPST